MPTIPADQLTQLATAIFKAAGAPIDIAKVVAMSLVKTNLLGHDSHGVIRTMLYVRLIDEGRLLPNARPNIAQQQGAVATVEGHYGFGQVAARFAAETAIKIGRESGVGVVSLRDANHIGRLGEYVEMIAGAGMIGIVFTSGTMSNQWVAPYGGRERTFGTNPMAYGVPLQGKPPLILDFATAGIAQGKATVAVKQGKPLPPGMMLDGAGNPTTDASEIERDGVLLPFGLHKGSGLALMMEILPTLLSGHAPITSQEFKYGNPSLFFALSIEAFTARQRFDRLVAELLQRVKRTQPAAGFDEVLLPGEPEQRSSQQREKEGIPISDATWSDLMGLAERFGIEPIRSTGTES